MFTSGCFPGFYMLKVEKRNSICRYPLKLYDKRRQKRVLKTDELRNPAGINK